MNRQEMEQQFPIGCHVIDKYGYGDSPSIVIGYGTDEGGENVLLINNKDCDMDDHIDPAYARKVTVLSKESLMSELEQALRAQHDKKKEIDRLHQEINNAKEKETMIMELFKHGCIHYRVDSTDLVSGVSIGKAYSLDDWDYHYDRAYDYAEGPTYVSIISKEEYEFLKAAMKKYEVTLMLIVGYYDEEKERPRLSERVFIVEAPNQQDAIDEAKMMENTGFSIWDTYVVPIN